MSGVINSTPGDNTTFIMDTTTLMVTINTTEMSFLNTTQRPNDIPWLDKNTSSISAVLETVILCVMWVFTVIGNVLVCIVISRSRRLQSTTNYFVASLACGDLCLSVCCMPFILGRVISQAWIFGTAMCKLVRFFQYVIPGANMYVLVCICADRFYTIIYPLSFKVTRSRAKKMVFLSWSFGVLVSIPALYFFTTVTAGTTSHCSPYLTPKWDSIFYIVCVVLFHLITPSLALTIGYTRVFKHIWRAGVGGRTFQRTMNPVPRAKVKMVKMLLIVNVVNFFLISPYYFTQLWYPVAQVSSVPVSLYIATIWTLYSSAMSRPMIYMCYNSNFRRGCREVFCMSTMKCYRSNAYAITNVSQFGKKNHVGVVDIDNSFQRPCTPSKAFDRSAMIGRTQWPLSNSSMPSTYL
ncbi:unnamed protein product [Owenia fusiformis]|uniref:Probable G-protein coupled receptor 19 n=1 Tax=Owenia fusiformis TaxID=6347 RepID=A0A8J1Y233_OWEFU|nr:unnamed protein product [Owenia fusiformis]